MNPREQLGRLRWMCKGAAARLRKSMKKMTRRAERRDKLKDQPLRYWKGYAD